LKTQKKAKFTVKWLKNPAISTFTQKKNQSFPMHSKTPPIINTLVQDFTQQLKI